MEVSVDPIRVLVADDEPLARRRLGDLLAGLPGVTLVAENILARGLRYSPRVENVTDAFHSFPKWIDEHILLNGRYAQMWRLQQSGDDEAAASPEHHGNQMA